MKRWKKILVICVIVILLGIGTYAGLYFYTLSQIKLQNVKINELREISLTGFTLSGDLYIYNGGLVTVSLDHINYNVTLETGTLVAYGRIEGVPLPPKSVTVFPFYNRINWAPTVEIAKSLITAQQTYLVVYGTVYVTENIKIPFERQINIDKYIKQFVKEKVKQVVEEVAAVVRRLV